MRAGGSGGCNSWFAQAELTDETLRLGSITSTLKGCTQ
jgi:heat shock protein HslJ